MADTWTDPRGQQHQYGTPTPTSLSARMRRSLERERVWSGIDPSYDSQKFDVLPSGRIQKEEGISPVMVAAMLGAPLAMGFLPGLLAGSSASAGAGGALASSSLPTAALMGGPGAIASQGVSGLGLAGAGAAGGSGVLGALGGVKGIAGAAGRGLGAFAQGQANNRGQEFGGQLDLERLLMERDNQSFNQRIQREQEGRAGESDAWRKLLATQYAQGGRQALPNVSPYATPQRDLGGLGAGSDALMQQVMARLKGGNPIAPVVDRAPQVDPRLLKPGWGERIAGYASPALTLFGGL